MAPMWPLVGRQKELLRLSEALHRREVPAVVLTGPAGVGKTTLANECLRLAQLDGAATAKVGATRTTSMIPFGVLAQLLPAFDEEDASADVLVRVVAALERLGAGTAPVLVVDDAHLLDAASGAAVYHLAATRRAFLILTVRSGEPVLDAVVAIWKDGLGERIDVRPLTRSEVVRLIEEVLGGAVDGSTMHQLWNSSRGNVLYLHELVAGALESGALVKRGGLWRLTEPLAASARLADLLRARLDELSPKDRDLLETLAVGEPLGLPLLEGLSPGGGIAELERRGFLNVQVAGRRVEARLAHPLYAEVLRELSPTVSALRRRDEVASALERYGARRREDVLRVATLRLEAAGPVDARLMLEAALQARFAQDFTLAGRLAESARQAGGGHVADRVLAQVLDERGQHADAERAFARLDVSPSADVTDDERAIVAMARSHNLFWGLNRPDLATEVDADALSAIRHPGRAAEIAAHSATFSLMAGHPLEALDEVDTLLEADDAAAVVQAALVALPALAVTGRADEAVVLSERGFQLLNQVAVQLNGTESGILLVGRVLALLEAGHLDEAQPLAQLGYDVSVDQGSRHGQGWCALMLGRTALYRGMGRTAARWFTEAATAYGERDEQGARRWCLGGLLLARAMLGDTAGAQAAAADIEEIGETPVRLMEPDMVRSRAWLALLDSDVMTATGLLTEAADLAAKSGELVLEASALHDLARIGGRNEAGAAAERLAALAQRCDGPFGGCRAGFALGMATEDAGVLVNAADGFERMGAPLFAAESLAAATGLLRRQGLGRRATTLARRVTTLRSSCEGAATPGLVAAEAPAHLSARERQVFGLASRGLTSREIGENLGLAGRTVENHLQRVYTKLGISSRADLLRISDTYDPEMEH